MNAKLNKIFENKKLICCKFLCIFALKSTMKIFEPNVVSKYPIFAGLLFFANTLSQLFRIWINKSSKDQSLIGWSSLTLALIVLLLFYKICCPKEKYMFWSTVIEILANLILIISIIILN